MITNAGITIYNRWINPTTKLPEYHATQVKNVSWYAEQKVTVLDKGPITTNVYKIRIPIESVSQDKTYVTSLEYAKLTDISNVWTIQKQDVIVKGLLDLEIRKPTDLEGYEKTTVQSVADNRRGSLPHWKIGGV